MTTIYLMRHGEVYNPKMVLYGRLPRYSLSQKGKDEVANSAQKLKKEGITQIYSSPMLRTRQTAQIVGKVLDINPRVNKHLIEVQLFCEGITVDEYHKTIQQNLYSAENVSKGQESIKEIEERMIRFVQLIRNKHQNHKVLAISHGDPILILYTKVLNIPFTWEYKINNYLHTASWVKIQI